MSTDRENLEKEALAAVSADDYYELADCLSETDDATLRKIIADAELENKSSGPSPG